MILLADMIAVFAIAAFVRGYLIHG